MAQMMIPGIYNPEQQTPTYTEAPTPSAPADASGGDSGFNIGDFIQKYIGGSGGNAGNMSAFLPAFAQAYTQYNNAGKYQDLGNKAAEVANPFGDRSYYVNRLRQSYDDPSAILNDPGHKIQVQRGLDTVTAQNAAKGYLGSGNMLVDLSKYASDSDATYLDAERKQLGNFAGAQFDPSNAAQMIMKGGQQEIDAKNKALDAMFTGLNMNPNPADRAPGSTLGKSALDTINGLTSPSQIAAQISSMASMAGSSAKDIMSYLMSNPNVSDSTKSILSSIGGVGQAGQGTDASGFQFTGPDMTSGGTWGNTPFQGGDTSIDYGFGPGENPISFDQSGNMNVDSFMNYFSEF